jgi:hypothetical protein
MAVWARNTTTTRPQRFLQHSTVGSSGLKQLHSTVWAIPGKCSHEQSKGEPPKPYVFTKCERVWDENGNIGACLKAESVRRGCKDSLRRLKLTRSISTKSTGRARRRHRRRLDRGSAPEGRRQGSVDRSVSLHRRADETSADNCYYYFAATALGSRAV